MNALIRHDLDEDLFPELSPGPDALAISARVVPAAQEPRIAAYPPAALLLVVIFRLEEKPAPVDPREPGPAWQLRLAHPGEVAVPQTSVWALLPEGRDGNITEAPARPPNRPIVAGLIYRGGYWVDLVALQAPGLLKPGTVLTVAYGRQASTPVTLR